MAARGPGRVSVLLPTYNERDNLPLVVWLLVRTFGDRYGHGPARSGGTAGFGQRGARADVAGAGGMHRKGPEAAQVGRQ